MCLSSVVLLVLSLITYSDSFTLQFERYALLSHFLMRNNRSLMLVGELGCGKSSLIQNLVLPEIDLTKISISPGGLQISVCSVVLLFFEVVHCVMVVSTCRCYILCIITA